MSSLKKAWVLRSSSIHAKGMFAARDIAKGERIIEYIGERIDKDTALKRCLEQEAKGKRTGGAMVFIFTLNDDYDLDGNLPNNPAKYMNHSCRENCEAVNENDRIFFEAKRAIREGEELTFDYGYEVEFYKDHPCRCGASNCCGYIVAKSQRRRLKYRLEVLKQKAENGSSVLP